MTATQRPMIVISCGESSTMINTRKLVYGHAELHDCLAFADGETATAEADLIAALRERGFTVTRDDELINTLDGQTFR
jgi:hypothetical protein